MPRRTDTHTETCDLRVPDRVFRTLCTQPCDVAITEAHSSGHGSALPAENRYERFDSLVRGRIRKMRVLQGGRRIVVTEKLADGEDRLAMGESHGRVGVAKIVTANILDARLGPHVPPEYMKRHL